MWVAKEISSPESNQRNATRTSVGRNQNACSPDIKTFAKNVRIGSADSAQICNQPQFSKWYLLTAVTWPIVIGHPTRTSSYLKLLTSPAGLHCRCLRKRHGFHPRKGYVRTDAVCSRCWAFRLSHLHTGPLGADATCRMMMPRGRFWGNRRRNPFENRCVLHCLGRHMVSRNLANPFTPYPNTELA